MGTLFERKRSDARKLTLFFLATALVVTAISVTDADARTSITRSKTPMAERHPMFVNQNIVCILDGRQVGFELLQETWTKKKTGNPTTVSKKHTARIWFTEIERGGTPVQMRSTTGNASIPLPPYGPNYNPNSYGFSMKHPNGNNWSMGYTRLLRPGNGGAKVLSQGVSGYSTWKGKNYWFKNCKAA